MIRRIGLLGGECTGKSVLASALERELSACVVRECLRDFVSSHGRVPLQHEQTNIMRAQMDAEEAVERQCSGDWLVCDPAPLMTAVYSETYFGDDSLTQAGVMHAMGYDLLLWCDEDIPWVPDGMMRDGPGFRSTEHAVIERIVRDTELRARLVSGTVEARLATALEHCAELGPG